MKKTIILKVENNFKDLKTIKKNMKNFLKENKETKPRKKDSKLEFTNNKEIKRLEKQLIDIDKLKETLKEKGLTKKQKHLEMSKALCKNSELKIKIASLLKDSQENILEYIQPYEVTRNTTSNSGTWEMKVKKSKGIINRHCYK